MCRDTAMALVVLCGGTLFAASPVAMLSSLGPVRIAGTDMSASTVALWPLVNGDRIEAISSPAVVILPDKSRITVQPGSMARVEVSGNSVAVRVLSSSEPSRPTPHFTFGGGRPVSPRTVVGENEDPRLPGLRHP